MFAFIKNMFFAAMTFLSFNPSNINYLKCVSMNNQECKVRDEIINTNNKVIRVNKCSGSSMIHMLNHVFQMLLKT